MVRGGAAALAVVLACLLWSTAAWAQQPGAGDFQKVTLDDNTQNPMELDIAPDGRVFYIERDGRLMIWKPNTQQTVTAGTVPVTRSQENGLLGLTLAPDFAFSKWVYLFYSQLPDNTNTQVVARFKVNGDTLDLASEQKVLTFTHQRGSAATRAARCTSAPTAACSSPPATTPTRSTRAATTRSTSAPAARPGTPSARAPTPTTSTARSCGSGRWRSRSARPASGTTYTIRPATSSPRARRRARRSTVQADGSQVDTIEGLARDAQLHPLQEGFWEEHGLQCGYCTPGMIMSAVNLLSENPKPTEREIREGIAGNFCRCTGYQHIVNAIQYAANKG